MQKMQRMEWMHEETEKFAIKILAYQLAINHRNALDIQNRIPPEQRSEVQNRLIESVEAPEYKDSIGPDAWININNGLTSAFDDLARMMVENERTIFQHAASDFLERILKIHQVDADVHQELIDKITHRVEVYLGAEKKLGPAEYQLIGGIMTSFNLFITNLQNYVGDLTGD